MTIDPKDAVPKLLYHGTCIYCLAAIVRDNALDEGCYWGKPGEPHGPRTTANFEVAKNFMLYGMHWGQGGILILDGSALLLDGLKVTPYRDSFHAGGLMPDEEEFAIETSRLTRLRRYLRGIVCNDEALAFARDPETIRDAQSDCGWVGDEDEVSIRRAMKAIDMLETHPLRMSFDQYASVAEAASKPSVAVA